MGEFKINELQQVHDYVVTEDRLYLNADRTKIVAPNDPEAASLFASEGSEITRADAVKYGLVKPSAAEKKQLEVEASPASAAEATEAAAKLAADEGMDLASVQGSGANGRITKDDVEAAIKARDEA